MSSYRRAGRSRGRSSWRGRRRGPVTCGGCGSTAQCRIWKPRPGASEDEGPLCQSCYASAQMAGEAQAKRSMTPASVSEDGEQEGTQGKEKTSPGSSDGRPGSASSGDASRRTSQRQASLRHQALTAAHTGSGNNLHLLPGRPGFSLLKNRGAGLQAGRRTQTFKNNSKAPAKAPTRRATITTSNSIYESGVNFGTGDIVSIEDEDDGNTYYAQIRGLLTNQFAEKFATLTWLLPTYAAPADGSFNPLTFVYGPNDEKLYPMTCITFHSHSNTPNFSWKWNSKEEAQAASLRAFQKSVPTLTVPAH